MGFKGEGLEFDPSEVRRRESLTPAVSVPAVRPTHTLFTLCKKDKSS